MLKYYSLPQPFCQYLFPCCFCAYFNSNAINS